MAIAIIDYGLGNLTSVAGAVAKLGFDAVVTSDPYQLEKASKLILPGVGAFGDGMRKLTDRNLIEPMRRLVLDERKPILGICLGCQLLAVRSEEFGDHDGLGWIDAYVRRLRPTDSTLRVPHVGWNGLHRVRECSLLRGISPDALFYYVHSYYIEPNDPGTVVGLCDYGFSFAAAISLGNIHATQFHPEKSQQAGLTVLRNFLSLSSVSD